MIAVRDGHPAHTHFHIHGLDGVDRRIEVTAFPLIGHAARHVGAVAFFWETPAA
jgi:hypothetical protein